MLNTMNNTRLKILIIDDTPTNIQLLGEALEKSYAIQIATSGEKGLQLAQQAPPDLILLDIMMPGMDGNEVCRLLKQIDTLKDIPVIFITALNDMEVEIQSLALGAVDFLHKPINIEVARLRIENLLDRENMRRELVIRDKQQQLAASVFNSSHDGIIISNAHNQIIDINASFTRITGYQVDDVFGKNPRLLQSGKQSAAFYQRMWQHLLEHKHWSGEFWNKHRDGHLFAVQTSISIIEDDNNSIDHFVAVFSDITLRKTHEEALKRIAYYDALTGMPNRTLLADRMTQAIAQTQRNDKIMAICYLDLDGFKAVNDQFGHDIGDRLLVEVTQRIVGCLRKIDTLSRIGGDEFVILLLDLNTSDEYIISVERILNTIQHAFLIAEHPISISASIGVTFFPQNNSDSDTLLRHADQAMYTAKQKGKNQYYLFDSQQNRKDYEHGQALIRIKQALLADEFVLFYQPKVNLRQGSVEGFEALIRWQHPQRGLLSPAEFLPIIENTDCMRGVSEWVIVTALKQLSQWQQLGIKLPISINIAPCHLMQAGFVSQLQQHLAAHPEIAPEYLELEVLETAALDDVMRVSEVMQSCIKLGVSFSLDDFGTGYSSLTYLKNLPADTLKIDQTFVRDMLVDADDMAIIIGTIGLAKAFKRHVIAEGVETIAHGKKLLEIGCELVQGYGIARPMPAHEINNWLERWQVEAKAFQDE
ncbi:MAG: hypothetical protein methR_P0548 [Methyloprofundus sp.]|nr:MAG: hypothetical protein methR_P0548 [Methyloprofundus sp.]